MDALQSIVSQRERESVRDREIGGLEVKEWRHTWSSQCISEAVECCERAGDACGDTCGRNIEVTVQ